MTEQVIFKYELTSLETTLTLPRHARVLCAAYQPQDNTVQLWALHSADQTWPLQTRHFVVLPTGQLYPSNAPDLRYVNTVFVPPSVHNPAGQTMVWHVFEAIQS